MKDEYFRSLVFGHRKDHNYKKFAYASEKNIYDYMSDVVKSFVDVAQSHHRWLGRWTMYEYAEKGQLKGQAEEEKKRAEDAKKEAEKPKSTKAKQKAKLKSRLEEATKRAEEAENKLANTSTTEKPTESPAPAPTSAEELSGKGNRRSGAPNNPNGNSGTPNNSNASASTLLSRSKP